jgi:hypothetical protein
MVTSASVSLISFLEIVSVTPQIHLKNLKYSVIPNTQRSGLTLTYSETTTVSPKEDQESIEHSNRFEVMRKLMTKIYDELMMKYKDVIYIGEDVEHGGVSQSPPSPSVMI